MDWRFTGAADEDAGRCRGDAAAEDVRVEHRANRAGAGATVKRSGGRHKAAERQLGTTAGEASAKI